MAQKWQMNIFDRLIRTKLVYNLLLFKTSSRTPFNSKQKNTNIYHRQLDVCFVFKYSNFIRLGWVLKHQGLSDLPFASFAKWPMVCLSCWNAGAIETFQILSGLAVSSFELIKFNFIRPDCWFVWDLKHQYSLNWGAGLFEF